MGNSESNNHCNVIRNLQLCNSNQENNDYTSVGLIRNCWTELDSEEDVTASPVLVCKTYSMWWESVSSSGALLPSACSVGSHFTTAVLCSAAISASAQQLTRLLDWAAEDSFLNSGSPGQVDQLGIRQHNMFRVHFPQQWVAAESSHTSELALLSIIKHWRTVVPRMSRPTFEVGEKSNGLINLEVGSRFPGRIGKSYLRPGTFFIGINFTQQKMGSQALKSFTGATASSNNVCTVCHSPK